jgi:hypothetical protein
MSLRFWASGVLLARFRGDSTGQEEFLEPSKPCAYYIDKADELHFHNRKGVGNPVLLVN